MSKLLHLIALSSLAVLLSSSGTSVNALSVDTHGFTPARRTLHHEHIAKKKRSNTKRCKARSSSAVPTSTKKAVVATSTKTTAKTTAKAAVATKAPSTSSSSSSSSSNNADANGGRKVGLAWPNGASTALPAWMGSKTKLLYTWSPDCPSNAKAAGFECVPMLWGWNQVGDFQSKVVKGYANYVLGPNEPNQSGQSNMDAGSGADIWRQYIAPLRSQGYTLVSPATTSAPSGLTWMQDFFKNLGGTDAVDIVALHWYDVGSAKFEAYVQSFYDAFKKPLWITEYACQNFGGGAQCTADETWAFHQDVSAWMDQQWFVYAYFPFGAMLEMQGVNPDNQLMGSNGYPNALGELYIN
ncbi:glycosyl hydrolase catalytic core-domain-containing protein [Mycena floridula]|nr:glycosyl hydrolase catalytic core-domain-containing protein [Mycena floridula]